MYFDAFRFLGASRLWNEVGPQPIPASEMFAYLDGFQIKGMEEREKYLKFIQALDGVELKLFYEKQKAKSK